MRRPVRVRKGLWRRSRPPDPLFALDRAIRGGFAGRSGRSGQREASARPRVGASSGCSMRFMVRPLLRVRGRLTAQKRPPSGAVGRWPGPLTRLLTRPGLPSSVRDSGTIPTVRKGFKPVLPSINLATSLPSRRRKRAGSTAVDPAESSTRPPRPAGTIVHASLKAAMASFFGSLEAAHCDATFRCSPSPLKAGPCLPHPEPIRGTTISLPKPYVSHT